MRTTINAMYEEFSAPLKSVVNKILDEAKSSSGSSDYLLSVANMLIKYLAQTNPDNKIVQDILITSIPADITNEELDWESTFDYIKSKQNTFTRVSYFIFKPLIEYLLGIKINKDLNEDQKKMLGTAIAVSAIIHFSTSEI